HPPHPSSTPIPYTTLFRSELAFTIANPSVQTFRQAISMDERRCMFRCKKWDDPQTYKHNRFNDAHAEPQDILQVWFAGVHGDIRSEEHTSELQSRGHLVCR